MEGLARLEYLNNGSFGEPIALAPVESIVGAESRVLVMTRQRQMAIGIGGCVLVPALRTYKLADGTSTNKLAITTSLLLAEPSLCKLSERVPIDCEQAVAMGYTIIRRYDDAVAHGIA